MKVKSSLRLLAIGLFALSTVVGVWQLSAGVHAQKVEKAKTSHPAAKTKTDTKPASPANNAAYAAKVKEYTTESYFMTELVDHLPASDKIPSPDKILGYEVGAPGHLTYTKDLYRYYRELEKATPRVRVFTAPEKSEEGKEQLLIAVGDEASDFKARSIQRDYRQACRPTQNYGQRSRSINRRRKGILLGFRFDSFAGNRLARDVDGTRLSTRG